MIESLPIKTNSTTELIDITRHIQNVVSNSGVQNGLCIVFVPHTTAGLTINENADPSVVKDIQKEINKIIPFDDEYKHLEGNSAAHIKSTLFGPTQIFFVEKGRLVLGTWQGIYFCEFDGPRSRKVLVKVMEG